MRRTAGVLAPLFAVTVAYLSLKPVDPNQEGGFPLLEAIASVLLGSPGQADKIGHAIAYGALTFALVLGYRHKARTALLVAAAFAYGVFFEGIHALLPSRDASFADILANMAGIGLGLLAVGILDRLWRTA